MAHEDLLQNYLALRAAQKQGVLSAEEFDAKVAALGFTDKDGRETRIDPASGRIVATAQGGKQAGVGKGPARLPDGFFALLTLILGKALTTFFRRLPLTILFGLAGFLLHAYLLIVINGGFQKSSLVSDFLMINSPVSNFVLWMTASALLVWGLGRVFSRKGKRIGFRQRVKAILAYVRREKHDAYAVVAASVGLSLVIGALVNGSANLSLALGASALIAARGGSVVALLARSAWNSAFSLLRGQTLRQHGMAIGYVAMLAGALGFMLNSLVTPDGVTLGLLLLAGALAFAYLQHRRLGGLGILLLLIAAAVVVSFLPDLSPIALAHDGGWPEYMGTRPMTPENILIYLQKGGSITALMNGLPAGVAAGLGAALAQVLNRLGTDLGIDFDDAPGGGANTRLLDGDAARDWMIRNGYYDAQGNPTDKYLDWMSAPHSAGSDSPLLGLATGPDGNLVIISSDDVRAGSNEAGNSSSRDRSPEPSQADDIDGQSDDGQDRARPQEDDRDSGDGGYFVPEWSLRNNPDPNNLAWDPDTNSFRPKDDLYAEKMTRQGFKWDDDSQRWVRGWRRDDSSNTPQWVPDEHAPPPNEPRTPLDEYYQRGDYLDDRRHHLTLEQQAALDRILDRIGYRGHGVDPDSITDEDLDTLRRLNHAVNDIRTGQTESAGAKADHEAIDAQHRENVAIKIVETGKKAAAILESRVTPWTRGAVSSFVYDAIQYRDKGAEGAIKEAATGATFRWIGGHLGATRQGDVAWNAFTSGLTDAAQAGWRGGNAEDMFYAGVQGAATGALFEHLQNVEQRNGGSLFGPSNTPRIDAGDDPALRAGSRGLGSDDDLSVRSAAVDESGLPRIPAGDDPTLRAGSRGLSSDDDSAVRPSTGNDGGGQPGTPDEGTSPQRSTTTADESVGLRRSAASNEGGATRPSTDDEPTDQVSGSRAGQETPTRSEGSPNDAPEAAATLREGERISEGDSDSDGIYHVTELDPSHPWAHRAEDPKGGLRHGQYSRGDCARASLANATGRSYTEVEDVLKARNLLGQKGGLSPSNLPGAIESLGSTPIRASDLGVSEVVARVNAGEPIVCSSSGAITGRPHAVVCTEVRQGSSGLEFRVVDPAVPNKDFILSYKEFNEAVDWRNSYLVGPGKTKAE
ncbi:hypothetical protein [Thiorhodococcus minor]|uniref:Uncharacterized protein n=1 Tax=Thiorhodococcus minor TaxID=57489 RepID=A0A6M0JW62_9GAMM|nr:hypothetical protein [Thiorhodococcus minor]NEV61161.1 hypothetical protein [Thiorhodococcus minor]